MPEQLALQFQETTRARTPEQDAAEEAFRRAGFPPEDRSCDHMHYRFEKHGRHCTCGTIMVDFAD